MIGRKLLGRWERQTEVLRLLQRVKFCRGSRIAVSWRRADHWCSLPGFLGMVLQALIPSTVHCTALRSRLSFSTRPPKVCQVNETFLGLFGMRGMYRNYRSSGSFGIVENLCVYCIQERAEALHHRLCGRSANATCWVERRISGN